jgi:DNA repair protein SbcD/Mre11
MKILHTSDWHLNERLGQVERQPDIRARLSEIAGYLEERHVDVMLVSGDLFSNTIRMDEVRDAFSDVSKIFGPFVRRGGTIIGIGGNHDNEELFNIVRIAMDLASPQESSATKSKIPGRLYLFDRAGYMSLEDPLAGVVQFCLLPYPSPTRYLSGEKLAYKTIDERNRYLHDELCDVLVKIQQKYVRPQFPTVLVSHLHVRGNQVHNLYHISETKDVVFDLADLPIGWAYSAFGHIHQPQCIANSANAQYAGSIDRFDFSEMREDKRVVLFEIGKGGLVAPPETLSLNATPIYKIVVRDPSEIARLTELYPDGQRAIVDYSVIYDGADSVREEMRDDIERMYPRWCRRKIEAVDSDIPEPDETTPSNLPVENVHETVMDYLRRKLPENTDRDDLLALAEELLATVEEAL